MEDSPRIIALQEQKLAAEIDDLKASRRRAEQQARLAGLRADQEEFMVELRKASEYEHRIYTFDMPVRIDSVQECIQELGIWVRRDKVRPIQIVFNSPGGSVFDGLALFDYVRQLREDGTKIDTTALGMAASMGGILLQAGEVRTMSKHSYMLIHEVSAGSFGNTSEMKDKVKFIDRLQDRCLAILSERSSLSKQQIRNRWERKDWWLDADQTLQHGFCDRIV